MAKLNLTTIEEKLKQGQDFELTGEEYRKQTGKDFPKDKSYARNRSAVAKLTKGYNFEIEISFMPLRIRFTRTAA